MNADALRQAFLRACRLDVEVRKPGNVSLASAGHRMVAQQFLDSAQAAAGPLFEAGASVGQRIEAAVAATWAAVGCNTNLGIVLLCAPLACAAQRPGALASRAALQAELRNVLQALDVADAQAAYRAIVQANPGGLGQSAESDVHSVPQVTLLQAMQIAQSRDSIARQYAEGFADVFGLAPVSGFARSPNERSTAVLAVYLGFLARWPDSHIVRKHGEALAQNVMSAAQEFAMLPPHDVQAALAAWDESLKQQGLNPGTSADLTVAALFIAGMPFEDGSAWHGS